jgi:hypothetical protein
MFDISYIFGLIMVFWYNVFFSYVWYSYKLLFLIFIYTIIIILGYIWLYWIWLFLSKYIKLKDNWNNKYFYIYVLRFLPFWLFFGSFISWLRKQKKVLKHIFLSNIFFIWFAYSFYLFYDEFIWTFIYKNIWWDPLNQWTFLNNTMETLPLSISILTLILIWIFGIISYWLWKKQK